MQYGSFWPKQCYLLQVSVLLQYSFRAQSFFPRSRCFLLTVNAKKDTGHETHPANTQPGLLNFTFFLLCPLLLLTDAFSKKSAQLGPQLWMHYDLHWVGLLDLLHCLSSCLSYYSKHDTQLAALMSYFLCAILTVKKLAWSQVEWEDLYPWSWYKEKKDNNWLAWNRICVTGGKWILASFKILVNTQPFSSKLNDCHWKTLKSCSIIVHKS